MRKLVWFTIGVVCACGIGAWLWEIPWLPVLLAGLCGLSVLLFWLGRHSLLWKRAGIFMLGAVVGLCWFAGFRGLYLESAEAVDGQTLTITALCTDYGYETDYGTAVEAKVYLDGKAYRTKIYLNGTPELAPGDYLRGEFRMRITTPGGQKDATYHQGKGIFLLAYQRGDVSLVKADKIPWYLYPAKLRQQLLEILHICLPEDTAGFAQALLLGERSGIDYEVDTAFQITGISHIIAVSGLHVSILFSMVHHLCLKRRLPTVLVGSVVVLLFGAVVGFTPSVTRACVMLLLMMVAMLFDREYDGPTELAFLVLVMILVNPLAVTSVSAQLSAGCIVGIFLFQEKLSNWLLERLRGGKKDRFVRIKQWLASSASVTLSAMGVTTPLCAYHFGTVSLVGILTNLLVVWIVTIIFYGLVLVCGLGAVWAAGGMVAGSIISWPIRYVLAVSKIFAKFPLAAVYTRSIYMVLWLLFLYVLLAVFLLGKRKHAGLLTGCAALGLCLALAASWIEPMMDQCRMTVLDVGQGQCILLQSSGKTYLVDCGGSYDRDAADLAAQTLMSQGIFRLDGIILTHYDADHSGGVPYLLSRMPVDILFLPPGGTESNIGIQLRQQAEGKTVLVEENLVLEYADTTMTIFAPVIADSGNESSLAVLFQAGNCDILITGDRSGFGERMLLRQMEIPELEILVAGHHGSKTSTCEELLAATRPSIVAISVGENAYGHPSQEVLTRLEEYGCLVYRTDRDGNLIFRR